MKLILAIFICLIATPAFALTAAMQAAVNTSYVSGGGSCQATSFQGSLTQNTPYDFDVGYDNGGYYRGLMFTASASKSVCRVDVVLQVVDGNVSGHSYYATIHTQGSAGDGYNLGTLLGTSAAVTGVTGGPTTYQFTFSSPVSISSGTVYMIAIHSSTVSTTNYAAVAVNNPAVISNWGIHKWDNTGAANGYSDSYDPAMALYAFE